jgi:hypothetical protein
VTDNADQTAQEGTPMTAPAPDTDTRCQCGHEWADHDYMGDCVHLDGRTRTGLCERGCYDGDGTKR